jgi:hypothetical protein
MVYSCCRHEAGTTAHHEDRHSTGLKTGKVAFLLEV